MTSEEIYAELDKAFSKTKEKLEFKSNFEELDELFFLKDDVLGNGVVSERYDRQLCSRIVDTYYSWYNKLHSILMPNPQSILNMTESQIFSDEERNDMNLIMNKIMAHVSKNNILGVTKDIKGQGIFIDKSLRLWNEEIKTYLEKTLKKIHSNWEKYSKEENMITESKPNY